MKKYFGDNVREYMLAILLEQKAVGEVFGRWPLHITLISWFQLDESIKNLTDSLQDLLNTFQQFSVKVGPKKHWGPYAVHIIDSQALFTLHNALLELIRERAKLTAPLRFTGKQFNPHITQKSYATVQQGFSVKVKKIYLIEAPKAKPVNRIKKIVGIGELK